MAGELRKIKHQLIESLNKNDDQNFEKEFNCLSLDQRISVIFYQKTEDEEKENEDSRNIGESVESLCEIIINKDQNQKFMMILCKFFKKLENSENFGAPPNFPEVVDLVLDSSNFHSVLTFRSFFKEKIQKKVSQLIFSSDTLNFSAMDEEQITNIVYEIQHRMMSLNICKLLLTMGFVDIETFLSFREALENEFDFWKLIFCIIDKDEVEFQNLFTEYEKNYSEYSHSSALQADCNLLFQLACSRGISKILQCVIGCKKTKVNAITFETTAGSVKAAKIICLNGLWEILELFLMIKEFKRALSFQYLQCYTIFDACVEGSANKKSANSKQYDVNYDKCIDLIIEDQQFLNMVNINYNPLMCFEAYNYPYAQEKILRKLILTKKLYWNVDPSLVEIFLNSCITEYRNGIKIDYGFLFSENNFRRASSSGSIELVKIKTDNYGIVELEETQSVDDDVDLNDFYRTYNQSIQGEYVFGNFLEILHKKPEMNHLIRHPVIKTYMDIKGNVNMTNLSKLNVILFIFLYVIPVVMGFLLHHEMKMNNHSFLLLGLANLYLLSRELVQLGFIYDSPLDYFFDKSNILELTIIILSLWSFHLIWIQDAVTLKTSSSATILFIVFSLVSQLHRLNYKLNLYLYMFRAVSKTFLKLTIYFFVLVCGFTIIFHLALCTEHIGKFNIERDNFRELFKSMLSNMILLVSSINFYEIFEKDPLSVKPPVENVGWWFITLTVIFVLISVVIINLINALAIGDVQELRQEAAVFEYSERVEMIRKYEEFYLNVLGKVCCIFNYLYKMKAIIPEPIFLRSIHVFKDRVEVYPMVESRAPLPPRTFGS